ncbi:MAG: hypothetical protein IPI85_15590 [Dehalococcoidia bacterium]|nr:hypothetical protein [Dehalococcoidia bacterium]
MAASEWKPKLANAEAEVLELRKQLQQERMKQLEPEEVKERLFQDPQFRKEYDQTNGIDPNLVRHRAALEARVTQAEDFAAQYLPQDQIAIRVNALHGGRYDAVRDQGGNVIRRLSPEESLQWFERDLNAASIAYVKQQNTLAPPSAPVTVAPSPAGGNPASGPGSCASQIKLRARPGFAGSLNS